MSEDINEKFDPADLDMVATDKDKAGAKMNIIMQLRKAADVKGNLPIKFADGKSAKLPPKVIELALKKFASFRKPDSKEKLQTAMNKSYKDMVNALKTMREETEELGEGFSPKEIKMAIGVATDKRYKGGNMTGATQAIDKIKKGLSDHPQVRAVLKRVNEDLEEGAQILAHGGKGQYKAVTKNGSVSITFKGKTIATGDFDRGADAFFLSWKDMQKGKKNSRPEGTAFDTAQDMVDFFAKKKITESYGSMNASVDKVKVQKQIDQAEKYMKTFFGNTSSVKMKKFAMQKKIDKLKAQLKEVVSIEEAVLLNRDYKVKGGKVYISKANFRKVHKDFKATAKGNEKMMVNGGSKGTILAPVVFEEVDLEEGQMAGWIAIYKGKKIEIKKDQAKDLYGAKQLAIKQLKVPKSGQGILSITPAYESVNESFEIVQDGGKTEVTDIQEAPTYKLYHNTFSGAVQEAIAVAKKKGFDVDEDDWSDKVATGPKKPSKDKTNSYSIKLMKKGKPVRQMLQIQVYNMGAKYELNCYVQ